MVNKITKKKNICIGELLTEGKIKLQENGNPMAAREAELLLSYLLHQEKFDLYFHHSWPVSPDNVFRYHQWINQRENGLPIQYITGFQNFMGMEFRTAWDVFIPRPETEILVEKVIHLIESMPAQDKYCFLDIGVGSGIIPIAICHYFKNRNKNIYFYAIDISHKAIRLAKENAKRFHCEDHIHFLHKDIFLPSMSLQLPIVFDGIISNPPYIELEKLVELSEEISMYEPQEALSGGKDGLEFYREIIQKAPEYLKKENAFLALEIGYNQKNAVSQMIISNSSYKKEIITFRDYYQNDRGLIAFISNQSPKN